MYNFIFIREFKKYYHTYMIINNIIDKFLQEIFEYVFLHLE